MSVRNPILPGFHPDPSILRVGDDYYLATSTFEWMPGVRLHHSRDLMNWRPLGGVLDTDRLLRLDGVPDSGGVWAPCLSHADDTFYLVFTNVAAYAGGFWDVPNYLVTAPSISGPWSEPVPLHARGFDPSLFHDGERSWLLTNDLDWRPGRHWSAGIIAQELDRTTGKLIGEPVTIYRGSGAPYTEGPHLYRHDGWYLLVTAEGGTGYEHQVTVARSRHVLGPYDSGTRMLSAVDDPDWPLQKAGHGSLVDTPDGRWYLAFLTARPLTPRGACVLGRETALAPVQWQDGWPVIADGLPPLEFADPGTPHPLPADQRVLGPQWSTLRRPATADWITTVDGDGVRLHGGRSPFSRFGPSLAARRVTALRTRFAATVAFDPRTPQHLAGLTAYYNTRNWYYAAVTWDEHAGRCLTLLTCDRGVLNRAEPVPLPGSDPVPVAVAFDGDRVRFSYGPTGTPLGPDLDATVLSDEHALETDPHGVPAVWGFTGAFVGLWAHDLTGDGRPAEFRDITHIDL
ncbi:glycoside hydrolase family 43 protein [Hamadaea sp. NPDC051192]|uniref:glycoside hydrolase family 43 protein n=1 Tax=Hamadaea sp. NPDC051192 TaxID=3154940 RepID=UPI00343E076D